MMSSPDRMTEIEPRPFLRITRRRAGAWQAVLIRLAVLAAGFSRSLRNRGVSVAPFKSQNIVTYTLDSTSEGTDVTWKMTGSLNVMMRVIGLIKPMDKLVGPDFEEGLANLKRVAEGTKA